MASRGNGAFSPVDLPSIADRLNALFAKIRGKEMHEFTTTHVAKTITEDPSHKVSISREHLHNLRTGKSGNPTSQTLAAIAKFFNDHRSAGMAPIMITYFFQPDADTGNGPAGVTEADEDRVFREKLADHEIEQITMRAGEMTPAARRQILRLLDVMADPTRDPQ